MQNKIFIDTNVVLDLLLDNRPSSYETKNLLIGIDENTIFVLNNLSLNNIFYVGAFQNKQYEETLKFLQYIENAPKWEIYNLTKEDRLFAYNYMEKNKGADFEDLQQYIAAKNSDCNVIVTNDKNFPKLDIALIRTNPSIESYFPANEVNIAQEKKSVIDNVVNFVRRNK